MGFKPRILSSKGHKERKIPLSTFENSNKKQKHNMKSLSGIHTHLLLITLLFCIYVFVQFTNFW